MEFEGVLSEVCTWLLLSGRNSKMLDLIGIQEGACPAQSDTIGTGWPFFVAAYLPLLAIGTTVTSLSVKRSRGHGDLEL